MGAGQRGLAEILPDAEADVVSSCEEKVGKKDSEPGEAEVLREQVSLFEDEVRNLIARINWLQENLQHEEESRVDAERQAESLRAACSEQAGKVEELSEQIGMLFQDLDEQHKHWTSLQSKLEFEQRERLHIEATLKAIATGLLAFPVASSPQSPRSPESPQSPQSPQSPLLRGGSVHVVSDGWTSSSPDCRPGVSWSNFKQSGSKTDSMFKELNSEWTNYKSEGKLGSWSLAKVLRRLSFSDGRKKQRVTSPCSGVEVVESVNSNRAEDPKLRVYDTAKLTEEIFSLNSEASEVRQRHLAELRKKLELQQCQSSSGCEVEERESLNEGWSGDLTKVSRCKAAKVTRSVSRSSNKRVAASQKSFESENKAHFKIESLGRQVFHLKKLCTEKTQLVKLEKRRRSEVENRYYVLVKNLDKQVLQLRKIYLRKADEIKQERSRRQEVEKRSVAEVENLERQVARLTKLAESRAHDLKLEQKQKMEAQRKLKDFVTQLKTTRPGGQQAKPERSPKTKQAAAPKTHAPLPLLPAVPQVEQPSKIMVQGDEEAKDEGDIVELEALQFRKVGTVESNELLTQDRQIWKLQTKHKGRFVLTQVEHSVKAEQMNVTVEQERCSSPDAAMQTAEVHVEKAEVSLDENAVIQDGCVIEATTDAEAEVKANNVSVGLDIGAASSRPASLTNKIFQLKETTSRLLKDLQGTQELLNADNNNNVSNEADDDRHPPEETPGDSAHASDDSQGMLDWDLLQAGVESCDDNKSLDESWDMDLKDGLRGDFSGAVAAAGEDYRGLLVLPVEEARLKNGSKQRAGWMVDVKRQLEFVEKLVIRLGGLVFDRADNIQEQLSASREALETKVEVLKHDLNRVLIHRIPELNNSRKLNYATTRCRYDSQIGLRFVCQLDAAQWSETSTSPEPDFF